MHQFYAELNKYIKLVKEWFSTMERLTHDFKSSNDKQIIMWRYARAYAHGIYYWNKNNFNFGIHPRAHACILLLILIDMNGNI